MNFKTILNYFETNKQFEKGNDIKHILSKGCFSDKNNEMIIDVPFLLSSANDNNYHIIKNHIIRINEEIISNNKIVNVHLNVKSLELSNLYEHYTFIKDTCIFLQEKYPNKLNKCIIYNTSQIFSCIFSIVSMFLELETKNKIVLV